MANFDMPVVQNLTGLFMAGNDLTSGWFGYSLIIMVFAIAFISMIKWKSDEALISSLFLTTIIAVFLYLLGLVQVFGIIYPFLGLAAIAVIKVATD